MATQNLPGEDGTLADDHQTDFFVLLPSDDFPGTYRGTSNYVADGEWWASRPGPYYWQAQGILL